MRITVKPLREEALKAGFASLLDRLPHGYSFEEFKGNLATWDVQAFCDEDYVVGMLMKRGPELHVAVIPQVRGRWLSRRLIREVFTPILREYGEAVAAVMPDNELGKEFTARLGFAGDVNALRIGFETLRFDPVTAAIGVGGSLLGGAISANAAKSAASTQSNAANAATNTQLQMFNTQNAQQLPYRQSGQNALTDLLIGFGAPPNTNTSAGLSNDQLNANILKLKELKSAGTDALGNYNPEFDRNIADAEAQLRINASQSGESGVTPGQFTHQFNAADLQSNLAPNYQFQLQQGQGAAKNALNVMGGTGGNFAKGLVDYTINKAGDAYQQAFNNYNTNQSNIFNRLSTVAGFGQGANQQSTALAGSLAPSIANTQVGAGTAQAAGTVGAANAISGGLNNALGWYSLNNLNNPAGGGTPYATLASTPFNNSDNYG